MRGRLAYELIDCQLKLLVRCPVFDKGKLPRDPELVNGTVSSSSSIVRKCVVSFMEEPNRSLVGTSAHSNFTESYAGASCETEIGAIRMSRPWMLPKEQFGQGQ
jgi:hypothetical protein